MIYLDNAATTLQKPPAVITAVTKALTQLGNAARGNHTGALTANRLLYDTRVLVAQLFHAPLPERVVFTANATEALNITLNGLFQSGDHIITTDYEHNAVLRPLYRLQSEQGIHVTHLPLSPDGPIDYDAFAHAVLPNTKAIVCTHASNVTGRRLDLYRIGAIAKRHGLLFIVDASQTAGSVPIDMAALGIDVLCFTGHKGLMGPQGTGGLCFTEQVDIRPWCVGGSGTHSFSPTQPADYPTRLEAGTPNGHGLAGLNAALRTVLAIGPTKIGAHEEHLCRLFYEEAASLPHITLYGPDLRQHPHEAGSIVSLTIDGIDSGRVADVLARRYDIAVRPGIHCAPRMHQALGTQASGTVRFSIGYYTTEEEVRAAIAALREIVD
ncbi:aminotransferase class V-fold PLP-dependent enzyme [uncultured Veillonella sp.]|uniref:aminotransferase class V-fold PLP-dependent enzyme n=1 Tax=uncultured Veillonella sp. TaxID=159268 RepID=UPI002597C023|nr:aminotransferase class V-fold PLP-dependent enzyme [uncultured Veillonella sp.]